MQQNGIGAGQVTQVRGFADQRLRKPDTPLDPSNRRISLIVQYLEKKPAPEAESGEKAEGEGGGEKIGKEAGKAEDVKGAKAEVAVNGARRASVAVKVATKTSVGRKAVPMLVHSFPSHSPLAEPHVVRSNDGVARRPMSVEEAVKEAAFRDRDVFVFRDHGGQAMVLHRKRDGKMELIEVP